MKTPKKASPTQDSQRPKSSPTTTPTPVPVSVPANRTVFTAPSSIVPSRQNSSASAQKPPPSSAARPLASRRNTAPADYFPKQASTPVGIPINTITTTISAARPRETSRRRSRLSILRRSSTQQLFEPPSSSASPSFTPISPAPSAPNPSSHTDRRATFQFTTAAEVAARTRLDEERLKSAVDVIRRDKPKDWFDPGWRDRERAEEKRRKLIEADMLLAGGAPLSPTGDGPLKKWEWGK